MTESSALPLTVRDYLYVDIARVRSLLSQMANGAPDVVTERSARVRELYAGLALGPISAGARQGRNADSEEGRSLTDLHFALFEESAEALGFLTDISDQVRDASAWRAGTVAASLEESQLIRVTAPVRLVDPAYFKESLGRIDVMIEAVLPLAGLNTKEANRDGVPSADVSTNPRGRQKLKGCGQRRRRGTPSLGQRKRELMGGLPPEALAKLGDFVERLLAGGISMRAMPCGENAPDCAFSGVLLDRSAYIEPERAAIFGRLGATPAGWTLVALVSRFGSESAAADFVAPPDLGEGASRLSVEELVVRLLAFLEHQGVADAPLRPTIAVTPLALYRVLVQRGSRTGIVAGSPSEALSQSGGTLLT
ncbi:MAG: DUF6414 family protein [Acidimicrobiales bacterium]